MNDVATRLVRVEIVAAPVRMATNDSNNRRRAEILFDKPPKGGRVRVTKREFELFDAFDGKWKIIGLFDEAILQEQQLAAGEISFSLDDSMASWI